MTNRYIGIISNPKCSANIPPMDGIIAIPNPAEDIWRPIVLVWNFTPTLFIVLETIPGKMGATENPANEIPIIVIKSAEFVIIRDIPRKARNEQINMSFIVSKYFETQPAITLPTANIPQ